MSENTPPEEVNVTNMRMQDFHCDTLELSFSLSMEEMDKELFLKDNPIENLEEFLDEDGNMGIGYDVDPREESTDYHAHMRISFPKEGKASIAIRYHNTRIEIEDETPPYAEDCAQWIGQYVKVDKVLAAINAAYSFDKMYSPVIPLPFPLVVTDKALAGSLVTGMSLLLRKETPEMVIIQRSPDDDTFLSLSSRYDISLKDFNLLTELERLSVSVNSLVKRQEAGNGNSD